MRNFFPFYLYYIRSLTPQQGRGDCVRYAFSNQKEEREWKVRTTPKERRERPRSGSRTWA